jgi:hypothetical protein
MLAWTAGWLYLVLVLVGLMAQRAVMEDRTLREELRGYDAYMTQVRSRLIPYVWWTAFTYCNSAFSATRSRSASSRVL